MGTESRGFSDAYVSLGEMNVAPFSVSVSRVELMSHVCFSRRFKSERNKNGLVAYQRKSRDDFSPTAITHGDTGSPVNFGASEDAICLSINTITASRVKFLFFGKVVRNTPLLYWNTTCIPRRVIAHRARNRRKLPRDFLENFDRGIYFAEESCRMPRR